MTAAVLLAAGAGTRFATSGGRGHKLCAPFRGRTVIGWAIEHARTAAIGPVYVVVGAVEVPAPPDVRVVRNPRWADGMARSLRVALDAAREEEHDAVVLGLGDQPLVEPDAWRRVAGQAAAPIAVATYAGRRGHPVRLAAEVWGRLPVTGEAGARRLMQDHPELVAEVPCPGGSVDVDTLEDLSRWS